MGNARQKHAKPEYVICVPTLVTHAFLPLTPSGNILSIGRKPTPKPTKHEAERLCIGIPAHWGQAPYLRPRLHCELLRFCPGEPIALPLSPDPVQEHRTIA